MTITLTPRRSNHTGELSTPARLDAVVIGAGQAGLSTGYHLAKRGLNFVILDAHDRVGDVWRERWDSLRLFIPAKYAGLPGMPYPAPPFSYPTKDELAAYFEDYAKAMHLPVRTGVTAHRVAPAGNGTGAWIVETDDLAFMADSVVLATGGYQEPKIPDFASDIDRSIVQVHASHYRNPSQLQPGDVLVVGASNSGAEIAIEVAANHPTILSGRDTGQIPFRIDGRIAKLAIPVLWSVWNHVLTVDTPMGRKAMPKIRAHGGPLVRVKRSDITAAGVERVHEKTVGVQNGKPMLEDGRVLDVRNIIWCTGFHGNYAWIDGLTHGADGYPEQDHGIATNAPGLYFAGLKFQRSFASMLVGGAARDAEHIADRIAAPVMQAA